MLRYLGAKFWMRVLALGFLAFIVMLGPSVFYRPAQHLTFTDEISTRAAAPLVSYSPTSGLTFELESSLTTYITELPVSPSAYDWKFLHQEWFMLSRQWFERLYADPATYNQYVTLWLAKRNEVHGWRISSRREFFPDLTDRELFDKIDWLRQQDEWNEMQAKIHVGVEKIEHRYNLALQEMLGENFPALIKLHQIFMRDNMSAEESIPYFL